MRSAITLLIGTLLGNAFASANPRAGIISHAIGTSAHNPPPTTQIHHFAARDGAINTESKPDSAGTGTGTGIIPASDALKADIHRHHQIKRDDALPIMRPESEVPDSNSDTGTGTIDPAADAFKAGGGVHKIGNRAVSGGKCPTCACQCPPAVNAAAGGRLMSGAGRGLGVVLGVFGVGVGFLGL